MTSTYQRCTFCVMDTTDPDILFDDQGVCNHCKNQQHLMATRGYKGEESQNELELLVKKIKRESTKKKFDVVLGISGGVDSAYALYLSVQMGLRVLAVHVDAGWNSEIAVSNIQKLCKGLNVDLHTIVIDWSTMRELQRSFMFSGIENQDIPQDHAFLAGVYGFVRQQGLKYMINGSNYNTEGILPSAWGYDSTDWRFIKDVYKKFGRKKSLKRFPRLDIFRFVYYRFLIKRVNLLNYINYKKSEALELLNKEFDWNYYGGKHFESRFTRYFQSVYLPNRFGYDKRLAHYSSLIVNKEITRNEALDLIKEPPYPLDQIDQDEEYLLKKLNISKENYDEILISPKRNVTEFKNNQILMRLLFRIRKIISGISLLFF